MAMSFQAPATLAGNEVPQLTIHNCDHEGAEETTQEVAGNGEPASEPANESPADEPADQSAEADATADNAPNTELQEVAKIQQTAESDDTFWAELCLMGELAEAERDCQYYEKRLMELTEERKDVKKSYEAAILNVRDVAAQINSLVKDKTLPVKTKVVAPQVGHQITGATQQTTEASSPEGDSWRRTSTRELLAGTKGMGDKKLDTICEICPTVGDLEDLRAEASQSFKPFKGVLPKGFGDELVSRMEERLLNHMANHSTPSCAEQVEPRAEASEEDPQAEVAVDFHADETLDGNPEFARLDGLLADVEKEAQNWGLDDTELTEEDTAATVLGLRAFQEGKSHHACDVENEKERDWMIGWVMAKRRTELTQALEDVGAEPADL